MVSPRGRKRTRGRLTRGLRTFVVLAAVMLPGAPAVATNHECASASLSPTSGIRGTTVQVTGTGYHRDVVRATLGKLLVGDIHRGDDRWNRVTGVVSFQFTVPLDSWFGELPFRLISYELGGGDGMSQEFRCSFDTTFEVVNNRQAVPITTTTTTVPVTTTTVPATATTAPVTMTTVGATPPASPGSGGGQSTAPTTTVSTLDALDEGEQQGRLVATDSQVAGPDGTTTSSSTDAFALVASEPSSVVGIPGWVVLLLVVLAGVVGAMGATIIRLRRPRA